MALCSPIRFFAAFRWLQSFNELQEEVFIQYKAAVDGKLLGLGLHCSDVAMFQIPRITLPDFFPIHVFLWPLHSFLLVWDLSKRDLMILIQRLASVKTILCRNPIGSRRAELSGIRWEVTMWSVCTSRSEKQHNTGLFEGRESTADRGIDKHTHSHTFIAQRSHRKNGTSYITTDHETICCYNVRCVKRVRVCSW